MKTGRFYGITFLCSESFVFPQIYSTIGFDVASVDLQVAMTTVFSQTTLYVTESQKTTLKFKDGRNHLLSRKYSYKIFGG